MQRLIKLPFYVKLCCTLVSMLVLGYFCILGQTLLIPLVMGFLCAIVLLPVANFLESRLKCSRGLAAISSMLLLTLSLIAVFTLLGAQLTELVNDLPAFKQQVIDSFAHLQQWISDTFHVNYKDQLDYINSTAAKSVSTGTTLLGRTLLSLTAIVILFVFTFIYGFFLLLYRRLLVRFVLSLFKAEHSQSVHHVLFEVQHIVKKYILGLLLQMLLVTTLSCVAFLLIGVKYSFLLALITGLLNIIPYIGIFSALLLSVLITFATSTTTHVLLVILSMVFIHLLDSNYIMPRIVGSKVKLNSLFAMMAIVIGEQMWGISGMFLSIPMVAIIKVIFDRIEELKSWGFLMGDDDTVLLESTEIIKTPDEGQQPAKEEEPNKDEKAS